MSDAELSVSSHLPNSPYPCFTCGECSEEDDFQSSRLKKDCQILSSFWIAFHARASLMSSSFSVDDSQGKRHVWNFLTVYHSTRPRMLVTLCVVNVDTSILSALISAFQNMLFELWSECLYQIKCPVSLTADLWVVYSDIYCGVF